MIQRPAHRPRQDPAAARVSLHVRVHPGTRAAIDAEAKRLGVSAGQIVDGLAAGGVRHVGCGGRLSRRVDGVGYVCEACSALVALAATPPAP